MIPEHKLNSIFSMIDGEELAQLALDLGKIRGPSGYEEQPGEAVYQWMKENGFNCWKQFVTGERFNVIGVLPGTGGGKSLAFNSHLDTAPLFEGEPQAGVESHSPYNTWREENRLYGLGVMNCRGPMSTWLIAAKALKNSGVKLKGDVVLTAVVGEIGLAPIEEYQGPRYVGKGIGTEYAVKYGPAVDYAVVSETTDFGITWAECGISYVRIRTKGVQMYSPRINITGGIKDHPNAIVKMGLIISEVEKWAREYEEKNIMQLSLGTIKPKVNIGAIRGGFPPGPSESANMCSIYLSIRLLPGEGPGKTIHDLRTYLEKTGLEIEVFPYLFKRGYIGTGVEPLVDSIEDSHFQLFKKKTPPVSTPVTSMWRDLNIYNEYGIPAITFGPTRYVDQDVTMKDLSIKYLTVDDMVSISKLYAMTALKICS